MRLHVRCAATSWAAAARVPRRVRAGKARNADW